MKKDAYDQVSRVTKAMSSPNRLEIIDILSQGEKSVEAIAEHTGLSIKNTSAQLKELKAALLVASRKAGKFVYYSLANKAVAGLWLDIRKFSELHLLEIQQLAQEAFSDTTELTQLDRKTLLMKARQGEAILLDVRPSDEFQSAHIPFAISVPIETLEERLRSLPKNKEIVAYCRGPFCVWAKEAVEILQSHGYKARHIREGVQDWAAAGLPLKTLKAV